VGKTYLGKVKRIVNFGAFVEILPGLEGLLHVSEIAPYRVADPHNELSEGDEIMVKAIDIDGDRVRLSRRAVLADQGIVGDTREGSGGEPDRQGQGRPAHAGAGAQGGGGGERQHGGGDGGHRRRRRRR